MTIPSGRRPSQDERFYYLFLRLAAKVRSAAERFRLLLDQFDDLERAVNEVRLLEHDADVIVLEIQTRANSARVTPLDPEDIRRLTSTLDDVVDQTEAAADRLLLFRIVAPTEPLCALADALVRATSQAEISLKGLVDGQREVVREHCHLVNEIENEADQILRRALGDLFSGRFEALEVLKWKEIYDLLETAVDSCENVADALLTAVQRDS